MTVRVGAETPPLTLALPPEPIPLEAITVAADSALARRLAAQRNSIPMAVQVFDRKKLRETGLPDLNSFVAIRGAIDALPCPASRSLRRTRPPDAFGPSGWTGCVWKRGWVVRTAVYIDGRPRSVDELHSLAPGDLYLLEIYGSGVMVQGHTNAWVERMRAEALQSSH